VLGKSDRQVEMWPWRDAGANSRSFYTSRGYRLRGNKPSWSIWWEISYCKNKKKK